MAERKPGRPKARDPLDWRRTVSLSKTEGAWLEELAQQRDVPIALLLRHIVRDYQEQHGDGRPSNDLRAG